MCDAGGGLNKRKFLLPRTHPLSISRLTIGCPPNWSELMIIVLIIFIWLNRKSVVILK